MFCYLDKSQKDYWLPHLFDLLYENMRSISPSGMSYEQDRNQWLAAVSPALEKAPRQIIMCFAGTELAGFMQYYIRDQLLMVEEIQLKKEYHRTMIFYRFCKHLISVIPDNLQTVEAYADKRNLNSIRLMEKLGMQILEEDPVSPFVHMHGEAGRICRFFRHYP